MLLSDSMATPELQLLMSALINLIYNYRLFCLITIFARLALLYYPTVTAAETEGMRVCTMPCMLLVLLCLL